MLEAEPGGVVLERHLAQRVAAADLQIGTVREGFVADLAYLDGIAAGEVACEGVAQKVEAFQVTCVFGVAPAA